MTGSPIHSDAPPPVLDCARVLEYAVLGEGTPYSGSSGLFVDGRELGPVPRLAICQALGASEVLLFHCDAHWTVHGIAAYPAVSHAKGRAEVSYPGVGALWVPADVTEADAVAFLDELFHELKCGFCGKRPDEVTRMIEQNGARICDRCVLDLHRALHSESERLE